jgi:hypothetical protein
VVDVIPTMIVFGVVLGRWWRFALIAAVVGWPLLIVAAGIELTTSLLAYAAAVGAANAAVGVLAHQTCLHAYRLFRPGSVRLHR